MFIPSRNHISHTILLILIAFVLLFPSKNVLGQSENQSYLKAGFYISRVTGFSVGFLEYEKELGNQSNFAANMGLGYRRGVAKATYSSYFNGSYNSVTYQIPYQDWYLHFSSQWTPFRKQVFPLHLIYLHGGIAYFNRKSWITPSNGDLGISYGFGLQHIFATHFMLGLRIDRLVLYNRERAINGKNPIGSTDIAPQIYIGYSFTKD